MTTTFQRKIAQYTTVCPRCKESLLKGSEYESIEINGKRRAVHPNCDWTHEATQQITQVLGIDPQQMQHVQTQINDLKATVTKGMADIVTGTRDRIAGEVSACVNDAKGELESSVYDALTRYADQKSSELLKLVHAATAAMMEEAKKVQEIKLTIARYDGSHLEKQGVVVHPRMEEMLFIARKIKGKAFRRDLMLVGPSGSGKSHAVAQMAELLGLEFGMMSCSAAMSEGQVLGRLIPTGAKGQFSYVESDFIRKYENGGVFLFDEVDAADPNMLLVLNSALANGKCAVPNRPANPIAHRHEDFVCVLAANTYGRGSDRLYCGRNELDEAFLDRFRMGCIEIDYSEVIEKHLCPNAELYKTLMVWRKRIEEHRLERVCSTRFLAQAYEDVRDGKSMDYVADKFFSGWPEDERIKVLGR